MLMGRTDNGGRGRREVLTANGYRKILRKLKEMWSRVQAEGFAWDRRDLCSTMTGENRKMIMERRTNV